MSLKFTSFFFTAFLLLSRLSYSYPQYYCTGANSSYYPHLLHLIGTIHKHNFHQLQEIAVFDLGMSQEEINHLRLIQKVKVHTLKKTHPELLNYFHIPAGYKTTFFGWYAWKPVAIKQSLEEFPYVLWIDAGSTVCRPLDKLFEYIDKNKYFICTIGDPNTPPLWPIGMRTTKFLADQIGLESNADKNWICAQECVMGGIIGVSQDGQQYFLNDMYQMSKDLRHYADDGTAPGGWAIASHDQSVLSLLAYTRHLNVFKQDPYQKFPMTLAIEGEGFPFYMTWMDTQVIDRTHIFSSRSSMGNYAENISKIRYR